MPLKLYGVPLSQPFRSVAWALLKKREPFTVKMVVPGMKVSEGTATVSAVLDRPLDIGIRFEKRP